MNTALSLVILFACGALPERGTVSFRPGATESSVPEQFRMAAGTFSYELEPVLKSRRYAVSKLRFRSLVETPEPENNTVHAEYFAPVGFGPGRPGVIVLHILGSDFPLSRYMAARMADRGIAALFVKLPYYGERRPPGRNGAIPSKRLVSADIERTMTAMRQAVLDVRRAACWLAAQPDIDATRLGVSGISLGGIVSALTASVDPAIKEGAFLLAGGDLSTILWEMPEGAPFRKGWIEAGRTKADLKRLTDAFDPLTYANGLAGKRLFFIAGKVDEVVPPACTKRLWEAAGKPPITWYDCGHYSAVGYLLPGIRLTVEFFEGRAEGDGRRAEDLQQKTEGEGRRAEDFQQKTEDGRRGIEP
jgi:dienelactone hydrolase